MSRTTIMSVWPFRRVECATELPNSWGFAPFIWDAMSKEHLGYKMQLSDDMEALWQLYKRDDIPLSHRAVLCMTFDNAYIRNKDYNLAATHIRQFLEDFPTIPSNVNHLPEIARILDELPDSPAIGFWGTSVSDIPFQGSYNEHNDDHDTFDWTTAFDIYDELAP